MRVNLQANNDLSNSWFIIRNDGSQKRHNFSKVLKEWTVNQSFTSRKKMFSKNKDEIYIFKWNKTKRICHQQILSKRMIKVSSSDRQEMRAKENLECPKWRKINRESKYIANTIYYFFYLLRFSFLVGESKNDNIV